jgi:DNA-binding response OmpR family regulator
MDLNPKTDNQDGSRKRILLVDDNPSFAEILSLNLEAAGYQVVIAGDGLEALNLARKEHPDLILLDLMLPYMDGHKTCKLFKMDKGLKCVPVIMITSRNTDEDRAKALTVGADGFISKPAEIDTILTTVAQLISSPHHESL